MGGAIDCSHAVIRAPFGDQKVDYRDRDGQWTVILQAVVDLDRRFLDVKVDWPGSSHDARVLHESQLLADMQSGEHPLCRMPYVQLRGTQISPYLLGDSGYAQCEWLMIPYSDAQIAASPDPILTANYNYQHSAMRMTVECSFGLFKSVFRILSNKSCQLHNKVEYCLGIIYSLCILHNWLLEKKATCNKRKVPGQGPPPLPIGCREGWPADQAQLHSPIKQGMHCGTLSCLGISRSFSLLPYGTAHPLVPTPA